MIRIDLHAGWTVSATAGPIPAGFPARIAASVPGCIHTDLLAAGLIEEPYLDDNESRMQWIGRSDFRYESQFAADLAGFERVELVCEGLDTVASIALNGVEIGHTRNQHRSYRFDVGDLLRASENELSVSFDSALNYAEAAETRLGHKPYVGNSHPYNTIRKMASNFGWDWGPVLVTAGIWKPIYLLGWSGARIRTITPLATVNPNGSGRVSVSVSTERTHDRPLTLRARLTGRDGQTVVEHSSSDSSDTVDIVVPSPALWWPRGYGDQPLYHLSVELVDGDEVMDTVERDVGFRTVEVRDEPDEFGTAFTFYINHQRVLIKGANWIPDDCFVSRVTEADYANGVKDATDAGINLLRIWGGGIYERDALYDLCNRAGVMVWQDFLFACAAYSEAPELWDEVEAEARENIARLASHPALVFYNGSNENVEGYYEWGWKEEMADGEAWGNGYYETLLPSLLADLDPTRPYRPSSPFSPRDQANPRDPDNGTVHSWEVWNRQDYSHYRDTIPRFVSEFGFQGPPNYATITSSIHDRPLASDSPGMLAHQKAQDGNGKLSRGYAPHLPVPSSFDDWQFTTQLNQARAISYGIEHFRSHFPRTSGTIIWQLNDCWPVTSWAAVDGDRRRKPLWYALRAVNAERLLTIQPRDGHLAVIASNDSASPWDEVLQVRRIALDGAELERQTLHLVVEPRHNTTVIVDALLAEPLNPAAEVLVIDSAHARRALWYFVEDLELDLPPIAVRSSLTRTDTGYQISFCADGFVKDLVLSPDRLDPSAFVDDMLVTLLPGEEYLVAVTTANDLDEWKLVSHPVLQSVNQLLQHARTVANAALS
jgi:beta-mannosidase